MRPLPIEPGAKLVHTTEDFFALDAKLVQTSEDMVTLPHFVIQVVKVMYFIKG